MVVVLLADSWPNPEFFQSCGIEGSNCSNFFMGADLWKKSTSELGVTVWLGWVGSNFLVLLEKNHKYFLCVQWKINEQTVKKQCNIFKIYNNSKHQTGGPKFDKIFSFSFVGITISCITQFFAYYFYKNCFHTRHIYTRKIQIQFT